MKKIFAFILSLIVLLTSLPAFALADGNTVEIGSAKRKVKDILEFTQGTIIELERQAGAPVDVVVNGNLIARGDVVVIDDNFAVRITEIVKSKFMDSLGKE